MDLSEGRPTGHVAVIAFASPDRSGCTPGKWGFAVTAVRDGEARAPGNGRRTVTQPSLLTGFAPVVRRDARVLLLGSMPGVASLGASRYYAHPANAFWPLMAAVLGVTLPQGYAARCAMLRRHRVALWDVVYRCARPGSLDAAIDATSVEANDLRGFLDMHRSISHVFFNGAAAEALFRKHVARELSDRHRCYVRLPSSSPAHAAMNFADKLSAWRAISAALGTQQGIRE